MIVFIVDKPGKKNIDPNIPFLGTDSYIKLMGWIGRLQIHWKKFDIINKNEIGYRDKWYSKVDKYIALGNNAEKRLKEYGVTYFKLPHPSGKNRLLNDKKWLDKELKKCKDWIHES